MVKISEAGRSALRAGKENKLVALSNQLYAGLRIITTPTHLFFGVCPGQRESRPEDSFHQNSLEIQVFLDRSRVVVHSEKCFGVAQKLARAYCRETGEKYEVVKAY